MKEESLDLAGMCSHLQKKLFEPEELMAQILN